jgi:pilus assembly protein Flp/PilA
VRNRADQAGASVAARACNEALTIHAISGFFADLSRSPLPLREPDAVNLPAMMTLVHRFIRCESGATVVEYALIAAGIGVVVLIAINALGTGVHVKFGAIHTSLN